MTKSETKISRADQKLETQTNILNAALSEFSQKGYDGTNIRTISSIAGVNHGLVKYHFENKDKLWKKAVEFLFTRIEEEAVLGADSNEGNAPIDNIKNFIRRYVRYCARHPEHARIMVQESINRSDRLVWAVEKFLVPSREGLLQRIRHQKAIGLLPDVSEVSLIYIIVSACQSIFMLGAEVELLHGVDVNDEDFITGHAEAIITLFFDHSVK